MPYLIGSSTFPLFLSVTFWQYSYSVTLHCVILLIIQFVGGENFAVGDV